ncbi:glycoside hydrolase [Candidatus Saccharibacteria bacterium]|nr:glycoside hydrolase [Candidatus Saccharibacteria bacterium]
MNEQPLDNLPIDEAPIDLFEAAKVVLQMNDEGMYTIPATNLYPHQWLWDSCFVAIGLRHVDVERAQIEILSLMRGQWANGMMPNMIFNPARQYRRERDFWRSWLSTDAPDSVNTSGITQPPMLAEAIVLIGEKLNKAERRSWYKTVFPALLRYHQWLYAERDPHGEGLVLQIHPWETGLDSTPPWIHELHEHQLPTWIQIIKRLNADRFINLFRRDIKFAPASQRLSTLDALAFFSVQRRLRRKNYDIKRVLSHSLFAIEDINFNSIFIRANRHLQDIAELLKIKLPEELLESMQKTESAFAALWDPYSRQYYSREFVTHRLLKDSSIGTLLPLYAGCISKERAQELVKMLEDEHLFGANFPIPSVPLNSEWFNQHAYWQGPTWVNMNWLIIDGLKRYGFDEHATALTESTLEMVRSGGFAEYFSPLDGSPAGADNFSWTAALVIDLLKYPTKK